MWWRNYEDLPFRQYGRTRQGCDCWGLVVLVYAEVFKVTLPPYAISNVHEDLTLRAEVMRHEAAEAHWEPVRKGKEVSGDVLLINIGGRPLHVGIVTIPGRMLHISSGINSTNENYRSLRWERRIEGFYRYVEIR